MDLALILVAFAFGFAANAVKLPPLVGYLVAGFVLYAFGYRVTDGIELIAEPKHAQFGDVVTRLPNTTYLAVNIVRCQGLKAGDADGTADPYVTV